MNKPPIIDFNATRRWLRKRDGKLDTYTLFTISSEEHKTAQRDADVEWCERKINEMLEYIEKHFYVAPVSMETPTWDEFKEKCLSESS